MSVAEILNGESVNVEYKARVPEKSLNYMKTVVAFANGLAVGWCLAWRTARGKSLAWMKRTFLR